MEKMVKIFFVVAFLMMLMVFFFPGILFFIIPDGESDHINIETTTKESFYFDGSLEYTFPKPSGYKYAIYEIKNGKKILIKCGESCRTPEFYLDENNFDDKNDVVSTKYTYKNKNYIMHQIENFILYKKAESEKYKYVLRKDLISAHKEDTFLYVPIKGRFERYGEGEDLNFLMHMEKLEEFKYLPLNYDEIVKDLKNIYKQNTDKYMKEFLYRYENEDYKALYNNPYLDEFIIYEKNNHEYEMVWLDLLIKNAKKYAFLKPVVAANIKENKIDKDKLKFLVQVNTIEENKKVMDCLRSNGSSDDHLKKLNYEYDGDDYKVIYSKWRNIFYCKNDIYYDVLNTGEAMGQVEKYTFLAPMFEEMLKNDRRCREYEAADFLIKAGYKKGFDTIIKRYNELLKELESEGGKDEFYRDIEKERDELIKRFHLNEGNFKSY
ncbi:MAG: hypothetical protein N4A62_00380 [Marinisporobacter sp.]|jgi:hypothetical protein|nr:hypothetical protein [Marinisporobacter sp.]